MSAIFRSAMTCGLVSMLIMLTGCSSASSGNQVESNESILNIPDSNPWKSEITQEFESTNDPFVRRVLADGVVTDEEWNEMQSRYSKCLGGVGLKSTPQGFGGAETIEVVDGEEHPNFEDEAKECSESSGHLAIGPLYAFMRQNPNNEDPLALTLECLKERGVVEPGMKLEQFKEKQESWDYMNSLGKDYDEC